jgi:hypothetical protein
LSDQKAALRLMLFDPKIDGKTVLSEQKPVMGNQKTVVRTVMFAQRTMTDQKASG